MAAARMGRKAKSRFGSRTDIGCVRDHNEDSLAVKPPLYVVADGMGGHAAGEVASEIAVQTIMAQAPHHADAEALGRAVEGANAAVMDAAQKNPQLQGMGTTVTAAIVEGEDLVIAQVGDSRAYLLGANGLQQATRDHSLMADLIESGQITAAEARNHPQRSVITRALGTNPYTQPDLYELHVAPGDRLLLCSDGLSGMVDDKDIEQTMRRVHDPQRCAAQLVNQAIAAGGHDNVTAIVVDIEGLAEQRTRKVAMKTKAWMTLVLLVLLAAIGGTAYGVHNYMNTAAYLAESDGVVAIYRGVQGGFLGMEFSHLETLTDIKVDNLNPGLAERLRTEGITCDNVDAAFNLVREYEAELTESSKSGSFSSKNASKTDKTTKANAANAESSANTDTTNTAGASGAGN